MTLIGVRVIATRVFIKPGPRVKNSFFVNKVLEDLGKSLNHRWGVTDRCVLLLRLLSCVSSCPLVGPSVVGVGLGP